MEKLAEGIAGEGTIFKEGLQCVKGPGFVERGGVRRSLEIRQESLASARERSRKSGK